MKLTLFAVLAFTTTSLWANPLLLKCLGNGHRINLDVEHLAGDGCHSQTLEFNGQVKSRYNITLCDATVADIIIDVQNQEGEWIEIDRLSTRGGGSTHCYLFRKIEQTRRCDRFSHECLQ